MKPKALFLNVPTYGHINPSLTLVRELARRRQDIAYFTGGSLRTPIPALCAFFFFS